MKSMYLKHSLLEPYEGKLSCTVLRGESPSNGADLLDPSLMNCGIQNATLFDSSCRGG